MSHIQLGNLVSKLDVSLKSELEEAVASAMAQGAPTVEIEHWFIQLLTANDLALSRFLTQQGCDITGLIGELTENTRRLRSGGAEQPTLSRAMSDLLEQAWMLASINYGHAIVTSLHLLQAVMKTDSFGLKKTAWKGLECVSSEALSAQIKAINIPKTAHSDSAIDSAFTGDGALAKYTVNLTEQARSGELDPVLGRSSEVRMAIDILCRKRQNNPILVGEPGVGKTAVVEGLALSIAAGEVPPALQGVAIHSLDLGLLQAGASIKGEFENRLKDIINEVKNSPTPIIVFIDEAHTLIGAGGTAGQNDAANLLKPALARGEFRSIAATTWAEYKKYFEKDPALTRRFQVIHVEEPNAADALQILRGVGAALKAHHGVFILEEALEAAVSLSIRYLPARQLPDKAISLLDTACARIALTQGAKPEAIELLEQQIRYLHNELDAVEAESAVFIESHHDKDSLQSAIAEKQSQWEALNTQWGQELELVTTIIRLCEQIEIARIENHIDQQSLQQAMEQLRAIQGDAPLVFPVVDENVIATVIENWTGIPAGKMVQEEIAQLLSLEQALHQRVIGQNVAINELVKSIQISRAGLTDSRKPVGVFLMCGPSGVGKTETAMALADEVFGGGDNLTIINMTEFKEEHKISMLLGSPAGYVGFGEGGVLTEAIRRNPYSVLLLDEMEKAHVGVHDLFYQIFDKGHIKDSEGRTVDFKNTIIIMTSNAADQAIVDLCAAQDSRLENSELLEQIRPALQAHFKPAFLGRTTVIPYYPLNREELSQIAQISLNRIGKKLMEKYRADFVWDSSLVDFVISRNTDPTTGGRAIEQIINRTLMPTLAIQCIERLSQGLPIGTVSVSVEPTSGELVVEIGE
ncbi:type VI secretion system ATPase TssH [Vibrio sp. SM6]|uniref:Type VI secretion system ATPase TssH n=1 Tax=Vibrio agarilyticus TaxID=2726741 RepID=A0A7X8TNJ0_9VIBR|nr:type VI secretion system ATPase TssH [Vibrio agarilyticus]NLS11776.1 type VI secretion system ATPase TssH [Vibrio agarilyticus]